MAISKIGSKALVDCSVADVDIEDGSITSAKLAGSIANAKLANSSITVNGTSVSLGASGSIPAVSWQSVITADGSTATSAVAGNGYFIDTTSNAHTINLPGSPSAGDTIAIKDYAGTFGTNNLTIGRNGNNIQGVAGDSTISTNRASLTLVYVDATKGWLYAVESNVDFLGPIFISATGGTVTESGDFKIHTFTGDGCFVVSSLGGGSSPCAVASTVDYLVVAGGGGGAGSGGGGGAGGFRESKDSTLSSPHTASPLAATTGITVTTSTYPITVGGGGTQGESPPAPSGGSNGTAGSNSVFSTITSAGGGQGGSDQRGPNHPSPTPGPAAGFAGGSGGGGGWGKSGGSGNTPPVSPSQGNTGGTGNPNTQSHGGGGGGGATAVGGNGSNPKGGCGGAGATTSITGSPVAYAGGGGGNANNCYTAGTGGTGGGGNGIANPTPGPLAPSLGGANTGGGGGGTGGGGIPHPACGSRGLGGKGIVVIRYKYQ